MPECQSSAVSVGTSVVGRQLSVVSCQVFARAVHGERPRLTLLCRSARRSMRPTRAMLRLRAGFAQCSSRVPSRHDHHFVLAHQRAAVEVAADFPSREEHQAADPTACRSQSWESRMAPADARIRHHDPYSSAVRRLLRIRIPSNRPTCSTTENQFHDRQHFFDFSRDQGE